MKNKNRGYQKLRVWNDAIEFMLAGAAAIQLGTLNFINPLAIDEIPQKLSGYCNQYGISCIEGLIGGMKK